MHVCSRREQSYPTLARTFVLVLGMTKTETSAPVAPFNLSNQPVQQISMLIYPGMTALDFIAPQLVFAGLGNVKVSLAWKTKEPVVSDSGVAILPTATLDEVPDDLDVLFVPGGRSIQPMNDPELIAFLRSRGERARYVTSVCTGALLLGAAGLLDGYRATTYWPFHEQLSEFGAIPTAERVVQDRNRITGGGVTAGMDFGLFLAAELRGEEFAQILQLAFEYDPQPPFNCGSPQKAGSKLVERFQQLRAGEAPQIALEMSKAVQNFQRGRQAKLDQSDGHSGA